MAEDRRPGIFYASQRKTEALSLEKYTGHIKKAAFCEHMGNFLGHFLLNADLTEQEFEFVEQMAQCFEEWKQFK